MSHSPSCPNTFFLYVCLMSTFDLRCRPEIDRHVLVPPSRRILMCSCNVIIAPWVSFGSPERPERANCTRFQELNTRVERVRAEERGRHRQGGAGKKEFCFSSQVAECRKCLHPVRRLRRLETV